MGDLGSAMGTIRKVRRVLNQSSIGAPLIGFARPGYRWLRTQYLRWRFPAGGYLECNGVPVFCDFSQGSYVWYDSDSSNLAFDQYLIRTIIPQCEGNVFIDVGAHFGFFSAYLGDLLIQNSTQAKIISLEPDRAHFRVLQETMKKYDGLNITLLPLAISITDGFLTMYKTDADCLHSYKEDNSESCYKVGAISLDTLARKHIKSGERIAFIKIDVDGAEPSLFKGGAETFARDKPVVFIEFAPKHLRRSGQDPKEFYDYLCDSHHVYWISYNTQIARRVGIADYENITETTGEGITDLIVSSTDLYIPEYSCRARI
jgi:FkbM family methyltransferase